MRVVLDTNILISALIISAGNPASIYRAWQEGQFTLLTCAEHLDELRATLRKPAIAAHSALQGRQPGERNQETCRERRLFAARASFSGSHR
jgi:uncharacterized protein